jgi:predicted nucleotidyltransferase
MKAIERDTGLSAADLNKLMTVFNTYPVIEKVILYGSRAMGNFKSFSDIDLTLIGKHLDLTIQQKIENSLDDLLLPYQIDLSLYEHIQNEELLAHIDRVGVTLFQKEQ